RPQGPSAASPARFSARRTPGATDNTSPRSPRSGGLRPPWVAPARPEHQPVAASQRSLQACIASLPLQSSLMSKTYLKSDHFSGGGSPPPAAGIESKSCSEFRTEEVPLLIIDPPGQAQLASTNKCLAQSNNSRRGAKRPRGGKFTGSAAQFRALAKLAIGKTR